jgi:hypothetical protein
MFQGFVELADSFTLRFLVTDSSKTPVNLDAPPTFRVYGPDGFVSGQSGSGGFADTGIITGASNASPIVITSPSHNLATGDRVTITGVGGNAAANGTWTVTVLTGNTFSLDGSSGNAAYTSGGVWNVSGLYKIDLSCTGANGYAAGDIFEVLVQGAISSTPWADLHSFGVV